MSIARRWGFKGGRQVVTDDKIQKLAEGINYAKSKGIAPRKYGPKFRQAAEAVGYTKIEAARLFNMMAAQMGYK